MAKQIVYPADTVDSSGKVWKTVGENIRKGEKSYVNEEVDKAIDNMLNAMYPVGYIYIGELPPLLATKFTWEPGPFDDVDRKPVYISSRLPLGSKPLYTSSITIPVMFNDADVEKLEKAANVTFPRGVISVPLFKRVA